MLKLAVAIADSTALPSAFVVLRGLEHAIRKAQRLGFDGVELALKRADQVKRETLETLLSETGLEISCISTGQVYADLGFSFTDSDSERRTILRDIFKSLIDLAADFGKMVNIGRVRGQIGAVPRVEAEQRFFAMARELGDYAAKKQVILLLEPVNRYELDFINTVAEGVELLKKLDLPNMKLMPDVFHMNIEDVSIGGELAQHIEYIGYIHLADSNRLAPGQGHTDFREILESLKHAAYDGWLSVEILPKPDPDTAAHQAIEYLRPLIDAHSTIGTVTNRVF